MDCNSVKNMGFRAGQIWIRILALSSPVSVDKQQ